MRKWFRSALAVLLAGVMMIPSGVVVLAGNTDSGIADDTIYNAYETPEYPRTAFIADDRPVDRIYDVADDNNIVQAAALESAYIPSGILTDSYPSIRNQSPYGTCWGFAPTSLAELSVLNNDGTLLDLSELHSVYFAYHYTSADGKDGVKYLPTASYNYLSMGGDSSFIYHAYANWVGVADEKTAPYSGAAATLESGLSNDIAMNDSAHLRNFYIVNKADRKYIKQLIKEYGGVGMSYYDDNQYYDYSTNSYYSTVSDNTNHAISVVGWDDDKVTNSSNKGAWLVRNSWGSDEYSHFGYFWMSYDEPSIYDRVYALDCVSDTGSSDDDFYDHNYQYDLSAYSQYGWIGNGTSSTIANIFTATGTQLLKAVGVETQNPNINYTVNIYTDIANSSNPESGTLVRTQTGSFTYQGFHTIKMDNPLTLTKGKTFSVVIKLESMDGKSGAYYVMESKYNLGNAASWYCGGEKGQSFYYNYGWRDMVESMGANVRIKAYTDDTDEVQIQKPSAPSGLTVSNTIASLTLKWNAVTDATGYEIYRAGTDGKYSKITTVTSTSYVDTSVKNNTQYSYKIKAYNAAGASAFSTAVSLKKTQISVSKLKADANGSKVQLSWTGGVTGAEGYVIYRRTEESKSYTEIGRTSGNTYSDTISAGIKYYYAVAVYSGSRTEDKCPEVGVMYLAAPSGLSVSNTIASLTLKWNAVKGATEYEIYRAGTDGKYSKITTVTSTSYVDTSVKNNTQYSYKIKAYNAAGTSAFSTAASIKRTQISVSNLKADANGSKVQLSWTGGVTGAEGYVIYRRTEGSESYTEIGRTAGNTYSDTISAGIKYYYTVAVYSGSRTEGKCPEVGVMYLAEPAVTGASNITSGVQVKWSKVTGATGYIVYHKGAGKGWARIADIKDGSTVNYTDTTAASGTTYTYTVRAYNKDTMSDWNSTKSLMRISDTTLTGASNITSGVQVKWSQVTGATGYIVYRKGAGKGWGRIADIKSGSTVSYTDTTAASGTTYTYTVRAYNGSTMGDWHSAKSLMRLSDTTVSGASNITYGVQVKWSRVTGATGYIVYRKGAGKGWARIADIKNGSTVSYTDTTAASGTTYTYTVRAYNGSTMGDWHSARSVKRLSDPKLTSASKVSGGINVRWTRVTGATGYIVYRKSGSGSWGRIADIKSGSTVSYTDRTAKAGTTYTYTVRAYSGSTMGDWSSTKTARR
ncbi:MAG: lectin like domain-containing protein [Butyrivibrio sp.]